MNAKNTVIVDTEKLLDLLEAVASFEARVGDVHTWLATAPDGKQYTIEYLFKTPCEKSDAAYQYFHDHPDLRR